MSRPTVAIVGAGLMGSWHARYARQAGGRVVAVVDRDLGRAHALATRCGAEAFEVEQSWLTIAPEIVHVCTPGDSHPTIIETALAAGCHLLVEKPLAPDLATSHRLLDLADAADRRLVAVHQMPFQRGVRLVRRQRTALGTLRSLVYRTHSAGGDDRDRRGKQALLREILPHPVSLFHAFGCAEVAAEHWRIVYARDDALTLAAVHTSSQGSMVLRIEIDLAARPTCNELTITGTAGSALIDLFHGFAWIDRAPEGRRSKLLRPFRVASCGLVAAGVNLALRAARRQPAYPGLAELIATTYRSIDGKTEPPVGRHEIAAAAALADRVAMVGDDDHR